MRKKIKKLHLYVALIFFMPLILQGLTGMILVFEDEISNITPAACSPLSICHPRVGGDPTALATTSPHSVAKILAATNKSSAPNFIKFHDNIIKIRFNKNSEILLNSDSLKILQEKNPEENIFSWVKKLHVHLLADKPWSRNLVGFFGVALLFLSITGIIIWFPKNLDKLRSSLKFSFRESGYKFHKEVHKSIGFWIFVVLAASSFSGVYLVFKTPQIPLKITEKNTKILEIDEIVNSARAAVDKDSTLATINFPTKPEQPFRLGFYKLNQVQGSSFLTSIFIDPYSGEILETRDPSSLSGLIKFLSMQHAIHDGKILGIWGKILIFIGGATPLIFSITGIAMWWMKRKGKKNPTYNFYKTS